MEHQSTLSEPESSVNKEASGDRRLSTCSPSSDTPETDAWITEQTTKGHNVWAESIRLTRKIERQRNRLLEIANKYAEHLEDNGEDAFGVRAWIWDISLENADVLARGESATPITPKP